MSLLMSFKPNANDYLFRYTGPFAERDVSVNSIRFACPLGDKDNTGPLIGQYRKNIFLNSCKFC